MNVWIIVIYANAIFQNFNFSVEPIINVKPCVSILIGQDQIVLISFDFYPVVGNSELSKYATVVSYNFELESSFWARKPVVYWKCCVNFQNSFSSFFFLILCKIPVHHHCDVILGHVSAYVFTFTQF
jgi:hypothetical protein